MRKRYSPKLKFQVVLEVLTGEKSVAQIAKAYGVHPNSITAWKREFLENGPDLFDQNGTVSGYEKRIAGLEKLLGRKVSQPPGGTAAAGPPGGVARGSRGRTRGDGPADGGSSEAGV